MFATPKKENLRSKIKKWSFNLFPAYRNTGGRIHFLSDDFKEIHIKLSLNFRTRNYVGTVFGGSIFGAADPIYMVQLINILGENYVVWDKSANIKFKKPINKTVYARFLITDELLTHIKTTIAEQKKMTLNMTTQFEDETGMVYAEIAREIFIADKEYYKNNKKSN